MNARVESGRERTVQISHQADKSKVAVKFGKTQNPTCETALPLPTSGRTLDSAPFEVSSDGR